MVHKKLRGSKILGTVKDIVIKRQARHNIQSLRLWPKNNGINAIIIKKHVKTKPKLRFDDAL